MKVVTTRWFRGAVLLALLSVCSVIASASRRERLIDSWRPTKFTIDLRFDEKLEALSSATATVTVRVLKEGTRSIDLDFGELTVDLITVDGKPAAARRSENRLIVDLPGPTRAGTDLEITVKYHGRPQDGLIFARDRDGQPTVVGDNWPDRVHHWIPCLDHPSAKAPVTFTITAPAADVVVANGAQVSNHANIDRTVTWTFSEPAPISPYNMIVAIGPFTRGEFPSGKSVRGEGEAPVPISWYVPRYDSQFAPAGFAPATQAVALFNTIIERFPYPKLALIVGATKFGGMENAGAIVFPVSLFDNFSTAPRQSTHFDAPRQVIDVVAHETAHQWFGDSVTESTWADLWLSEGFATYFSGIFRERTEGQKSFRAYMNEAATEYLAYEKLHRTPIHDTETESLMALLNANNYQKGAWVLHMLRGQLGDKAFFTGMRDYYASHRNSVATTDDLRKTFEKSSGQDLREFFTRWIYGAGHPVYDVTWRWSSHRPEGTVTVTVAQTQPDAMFPNEVPVEFTVGSAVIRKSIKPTGKSMTATFTLSGKPAAVRIDPDGFILKDVTVNEVRAAVVR